MIIGVWEDKAMKYITEIDKVSKDSTKNKLKDMAKSILRRKIVEEERLRYLLKASVELEEIRNKSLSILEFIQNQNNKIASRRETMNANLSGAEIHEALVEYNQKSEKIFEDLQRDVDEKVIDAQIKKIFSV